MQTAPVLLFDVKPCGLPDVSVLKWAFTLKETGQTSDTRGGRNELYLRDPSS